MSAGFVIAGIGLVALLIGGRISSSRVRKRHGSEVFRSKAATHSTAGTGTVPVGVSLLTLSGWGLLVVGIVVLVAAAV